MSDRFGRKPVLILAAANFIVSSLGIALVDRFTPFYLWRILGGVSIGLASTASPMYISEISPANRRGLLVAVNQLTIVLGIFLATFANKLIARPETKELKSLAGTAKKLAGDELEAANRGDAVKAAEFKDERNATQEKYQEVLAATWNGQTGWRWMFAACAVPSLLFFLGSLVVPESPRWLTKAGRNQKAQEILTLIGGAQYAAAAEKEIRATLMNESKKVRLGELLEKGMRYILLLGCTLAVLQQWCGINVIFNYSVDLFKLAGYGMDDALTYTVYISVVNLLFVFVALATVDKARPKTADAVRLWRLEHHLRRAGILLLSPRRQRRAVGLPLPAALFDCDLLHVARTGRLGADCRNLPQPHSRDRHVAGGLFPVAGVLRLGLYV